MEKGIIIFAIGHSNYYRMAENLAASLVVAGSKQSGIRICLICDSKEKVINKCLIDDYVIVDMAEFTGPNGFVYMDAIINAYSYSPYKRTLKLDADMIWLKKNPAILFDELDGVGFTISNKGFYPIGSKPGLSVWAKEEDIIEAYNLKGDEPMFMLSAECFYFEKSRETSKIFSEAKKIYKAKKIKGTAFSNATFTEELAFQIAMLRGITKPHQTPFAPIYNDYIVPDKSKNRLYAYQLTEFFGYSAYGNATSAFKKMNYDTLAVANANKLGLPKPYKLSEKRTYLPERIKL